MEHIYANTWTILTIPSTMMARRLQRVHIVHTLDMWLQPFQGAELKCSLEEIVAAKTVS
jgi:hypothetical protein